MEAIAYLISGKIANPSLPDFYPLCPLHDPAAPRHFFVDFQEGHDLGYVEPMTKILENRPVDRLAFRGASVFCRRIISTSLFVALTVSLAAARDLAVVSNKANSVATISVADLVKVCKAQTNRWPDGKPVTLIMRAPSAPEMKLFLEKVYELPEAQVQDLIATANHGRANHPAIMIADSDEELVNKVASIPGAVGIVDVYAINSSVAVVKLAGKLPLEPGYLLHGN
ncbi:MAG TPA: hypothetical protein VMG82_38600 [Candidatus Sulfotelmatobacter sp.]|nr:hypothetical protein [Candidatus Sulfotelmatobacter sp.]